MRTMICGSCERRVDPNRSFCMNCGSSVFIDERRDRPMSAAAAPQPPATSSFLQSLQDAIKSAQTSSARSLETAKTFDRATATVARKARARARAAASTKTAASFSLGPLIRLVIFVGLVWYVGKWLIAIPEVIVLKERAQAGHFSDGDLQAARDAIGARIQTFLRNSQDPNPPPRTPERPAEAPSPRREPSAGGAVRPDALVMPAPETATAPPGVSLPGDGVTLPRVVRQVPPAYTPEALRAKIEGTVVLQAVVRTHGVASDISVVRSLDRRFGLDDQAIVAVKGWRFAPGRRGAQPVPVLVHIAITFSLR